MKIQDLQKIDIKDLKDIDWQQVQNRLLSQPGALINTVIILLTVVVMTWSYKKHTGIAQSFNSKKTELQGKSAALTNFKTLQEQYGHFVDNIPQIISEDQLIEILSDFALKWDIEISSFSPAQERGNDYINLTNVEINITSSNYADIIRFLKDIESSPYSIRIGRWSGTSSTPTQDSQRRFRRTAPVYAENAANKEIIKATIEIESVEFKNG